MSALDPECMACGQEWRIHDDERCDRISRGDHAPGDNAYLVRDASGEFRVLANIPNWTADSPWHNIICEARDEATASRLLQSLSLESQNQALQDRIEKAREYVIENAAVMMNTPATWHRFVDEILNLLSTTQETDPE